MVKDMTDRELLIRIDERQQALCKELAKITKELKRKVDRDEDYHEVERWSSDWRDTKNKMVGYLIGASVGGGLIVKLISDIPAIVSGIFAR